MDKSSNTIEETGKCTKKTGKIITPRDLLRNLKNMDKFYILRVDSHSFSLLIVLKEKDVFKTVVEYLPLMLIFAEHFFIRN